MAGKGLSPKTERAILKYAPQINQLARQRYGVSGRVLLRRLIYGESADNPNAVSSAGARGRAQFMPGTRDSFLKQYGVDAWGSPDESVHAAVLHLQGKGGHSPGLEGYNPGGGQSYVNYILSRRPGAPNIKMRGESVPLKGNRVEPRPVEPTTRPVTEPTRRSNSSTVKVKEDVEGAIIDTLLGGGSRNGSLAKQVVARLDSGAYTTTTSVAKAKVTRGRTTEAQVTTSQGALPPTGQQRQPGSVSPIMKIKEKIIGTPYAGTHNLGNWQSDNAVDLAMPVGTKLFIPRDGVVEKVKGGYAGGSSRFDGYQVTVRLANGQRLFYTHLSGVHVKAGQKLRAGGLLGQSGAANGVPHLHLGVERGDPRDLLRRIHQP